MFDRWFEPHAIDPGFMARSLEMSSPHGTCPHRGKSGTNALMALGGVTVFFVLLIVGLVAFAEPVPGKQANYPRLALLIGGTLAAAGIGVWYFTGFKNKTFARRIESLRGIEQRTDGLRYVGYCELDGAGQLPWYHSEEWIHLYGLLHGKLRNHRFAYLEGTHIVDPFATLSNSSMMRAAGVLAGNKHKRLKLQAFDACLFLDPVDLPDLLVVPKMSPQRGYYQSALSGRYYEVSTPRSLRNYWVATSSPSGFEGLFDSPLATLLASRSCTVQVLGGYCAVLTRTWNPNEPFKVPKTESEILADIEFGGAVHDAITNLAGKSQPELARPDTAMRETGWTSELATQREPTTAISLPRRRRWGLIGCGAPLAFLGFVVAASVGMLLYSAIDSVNWPVVEGQVVSAVVRERSRNRNGNQVTQYRPRIEYKYEHNGKSLVSSRVNFGPEPWSEDKRTATAVIEKYPEGAKVDVYVSGTIATLERGLPADSFLPTIVVIGVGMFAVGIIIFAIGWRGKKPVP